MNQTFNLFSKAADGTGEAVPLLVREDFATFPRLYLSDSTGLLFHRQRTADNHDIWILHLGSEPNEEILLGTPFAELEPSLSHDARWLAYVSNESGRREVYVRPFPDGEGRWPVSTEGGDEPVWSPAGGELFYRSGNRMMSVSVADGSDLDPGAPEVLFEGEYERDPFLNGANRFDAKAILRPSRAQTGSVERPSPNVSRVRLPRSRSRTHTSL